LFHVERLLIKIVSLLFVHLSLLQQSQRLLLHSILVERKPNRLNVNKLKVPFELGFDYFGRTVTHLLHLILVLGQLGIDLADLLINRIGSTVDLNAKKGIN
jgi:hypothetical protein